MSRIQYENKQSLANESKFKEKIIKVWDCDLKKMHYHHVIDFMVVEDKKAKAWLEVKCRNRNYNQFPHVMLSLNKYMKGIDYYSKTKLPFILAIRFLDGDYYFKYHRQYPTFDIVWGGRTKNQRDEFDVEPIINIPTTYFTEF